MGKPLRKPIPFRIQGNFSGIHHERVKKLDGRDLTALIRAEVKKAVETGALPPAKYGVNFQRLTWGKISIYMTVEGLEGSSVEVAIQELLKIRASYNYDHGDSMVDYFDRGFYGHIRINGECHYG